MDASSGGGMRVIGLAGGIGSGKSTVAQAFRAAGAEVFDADDCVRKLFGSPEVKGELVGAFGPAVLGPDGSVDRAGLADRVFADAHERARLEGVLHPRVTAEAEAWLDDAGSRGVRWAVLDVPLLFEVAMDDWCDTVVFVEASRRARLERVSARGWDGSELDRREAAQMDIDEKRDRSSSVVDNCGEQDEIVAQVRQILDRLR